MLFRGCPANSYILCCLFLYIYLRNLVLIVHCQCCCQKIEVCCGNIPQCLVMVMSKIQKGLFQHSLPRVIRCVIASNVLHLFVLQTCFNFKKLQFNWAVDVFVSSINERVCCVCDLLCWQILLEPYTYLLQISGKEVRSFLATVSFRQAVDKLSAVLIYEQFVTCKCIIDNITRKTN